MPESVLASEPLQVAQKVVPSDWRVIVADVAEKTLHTWWQAFLALLVATEFFEFPDLSILASAAVAAVPAALTTLLNFVQSGTESASWPVWAQGLFRLVRTGLVAFLGFLITLPWILDSLDLAAAGSGAWAAAVAAVLAFIKAEAVARVTNGTPSTLPARLDPSLTRV